MLTKKDLQMIADAIRTMDLHDERDREIMARHMASALRRASGNPNFDTDRFVRASLPEEGGQS